MGIGRSGRLVGVAAVTFSSPPHSVAWAVDELGVRTDERSPVSRRVPAVEQHALLELVEAVKERLAQLEHPFVVVGQRQPAQ